MASNYNDHQIEKLMHRLQEQLTDPTASCLVAELLNNPSVLEEYLQQTDPDLAAKRLINGLRAKFGSLIDTAE